eukprot:gene5909-7358_t
MAVNVVELVDKATSDYLVQMDWGTCLQLCDILNNDHQHARTVVKQIIKRFKEKSRVILLALELSDSLIQNCECTHVFFGERTYQTELAKLVMNKKSKESVKDKALELIDSWGNAFQQRHDIPGFYENYSFIRTSGYKFPPRRPDAPILNFNQPRDRRIQQQQQQQPQYQNGGAYHHQQNLHSHRMSVPAPISNGPGAASAGGTTTTSQELSSIKGSISVFSEMISFLNVEEEDPAENDLIKELYESTKQSQNRVKELIESGPESERNLNLLLSLNDEILRSIGDYEQCLAKRKAFVANGYKQTRLPPPTSNHNHNNNHQNSTANLNKPSAPPANLMKHQELSEIDFFSVPSNNNSNSNPFIGAPQNPQYFPPNNNINKPPQQPQPNFNPFAGPPPPQFSNQPPIQQPQQPQQQSQQKPNFDDFDLFVNNRQQQQQNPQQQKPQNTNSNPFSNPYNNNTNNNQIQPYVPSTAKSLPNQQSAIQPYKGNGTTPQQQPQQQTPNSLTQTLPSAPPPFRQSNPNQYNLDINPFNNNSNGTNTNFNNNMNNQNGNPFSSSQYQGNQPSNYPYIPSNTFNSQPPMMQYGQNNQQPMGFMNQPPQQQQQMFNSNPSPYQNYSQYSHLASPPTSFNNNINYQNTMAPPQPSNNFYPPTNNQGRIPVSNNPNDNSLI